MALGLLTMCVIAPVYGAKGLLEPAEFVIEDFEGDQALERWRFDRHQAGAEGKCVATLSSEWASQGERSSRVVFRAGDGWPNIQTRPDQFEEWPNFAEFEHFHVDMLNPAAHPAPKAGDNSHGIIFFTEEGPRPDSITYRLEPNQHLHLTIDIPEQLGKRRGEPLDTSLINAFHFYAWNPSVHYVRYIDTIRLTRDLGSHFDELQATLDLLEEAGLAADAGNALRRRATVERERLADLPFSAANLAEARQVIADLERDIAQHDVILSRYTARIRSLLARRTWNAQVRDQLEALAAEISSVREAILGQGGLGSEYERRALQRLRSEMRVLNAALANARAVLPQASPERGFVVGWTHPSTFVKPYGKPFNGDFGQATVAGARGETVGVQVVVLALEEDVASVRPTVLSEDLPDDSVTLHALGFMNLGTAPERSPAYLMQWYPDILSPAPTDGITVPAGTPQPYLLELRIPRDADAGLHRLSVRVESGVGATELPVALRVYDFEVPEEFSLKTTCHHRPADAPVLVRYGLDPGGIYGGWIGAEDEAIVKQYRLGQQLFNIGNQKNGWIAYTRKGWAFDPERGTLEENWERYLSKYEEFLARMEELGIPKDRFFFYGFDEVPPSEEIRDFTARLRSLGVPVMGTPMGSGWLQEPVETFDMWAGGLGSGEARRERIAQIHEAGGQAWWYDNNLGFDPDVWIARQKGWYARHWMMDGYLIYSASAWTARDEKHLDRPTLPYSNWHEPSRGARGAACALTYYWGDKAADRYPCLRLWNFRAGLYDYEYLVLLDAQAEALARSGVESRHQKLLARARQLTRVPESLLQVPAVEASADLVLNLPGTHSETSGVRSLLLSRAKAAELIETLRSLSE